jgi:HAD superfamily hydrolase (TIGR01484 family)
MVVSDLDGTLLFQGVVDPVEVDSLRSLGERRILRALATGRAWASTLKVLGPDFPIDYLIFSSGAGVVDWKTGELLVCHNLNEDQTHRATRVFLEHDLDFMIHDPIPEAHPFVFRRTPRSNVDFDARFKLHGVHGTPFTAGMEHRIASQLLAICPEGDPEHPFQVVKAKLPDLTVVRATSPLDGNSIWLEAFSNHVSKAQGAAWVAQRHGIPVEKVLAVGNDYNDIDLLDWAGTSFLMDNAPLALRPRYDNVPSAERRGLTAALKVWKAH